MRVTNMFGVAVAAAALAASFAACDSRSDYEGPHTTACSTGPAYDLDNYPPPGATTQHRNVPECVPRCGAEAKFPGLAGPIYSIAALPSGSCSYEGEECGLAASPITTCPESGSHACSLSAYECHCERGSWRCYVVAQGMGVCPCSGDAAPPEDSSTTDAGTDTD